jgi:hypothetical protein
MVLSVLSLPLFWLTLFIIYLVQLFLSHCQACGMAAIVNRSCYIPLRYWRSAIGLYLFNYSTMANTLIGYLFCINVGNGRTDHTMMTEEVVFVSPTISCNSNEYKVWLPVVVLLLIILIIVPPIGSLVYLTRNRYQFVSPSFIGRFGNLYDAYQSSSYWWQSLVLLRRVVFTLVEVLLVILPSFKFMIFGFLHLLSLVIHVIMQPYSTKFFNQMELLTLLSLTSVALIMTAFPDEKTLEKQSSIFILSSIVVLVPVLAFIIHGLRTSIHTIKRCWYNRRLPNNKRQNHERNVAVAAATALDSSLSVSISGRMDLLNDMANMNNDNDVDHKNNAGSDDNGDHHQLDDHHISNGHPDNPSNRHNYGALVEDVVPIAASTINTPFLNST